MGSRGLVAMALAAACVVVGCAESETPEAKAARGRTIGMTFMSLSNPFFQACRRSAKAVVDARGDKLMVVNAERKSSVQLSGVENFVQAGVACILLNPVNSDAAGKAVEKANAAGIPVVTFDVTASGGKIACFVESNNYLAGQLCADYIGWRLKGKGNVVIINHPEVTSVKQRVAGFKEHLAKTFPGVKIIGDQAAKGTKEKSLEVTENLLRAHADIDAIFGINDPSALGAAQAVKAAKNIRIFVVGIDGAPDAVAELRKAGPLAMTVAQFPQEIGRVAAEMAYKILDGEPAPEHVRIPVMPVTAGNLDVYPTWEGKMLDKVEVPWKSDIQIGQETP